MFKDLYNWILSWFGKGPNATKPQKLRKFTKRRYNENLQHGTGAWEVYDESLGDWLLLDHLVIDEGYTTDFFMGIDQVEDVEVVDLGVTDSIEQLPFDDDDVPNHFLDLDIADLVLPEPAIDEEPVKTESANPEYTPKEVPSWKFPDPEPAPVVESTTNTSMDYTSGFSSPSSSFSDTTSSFSSDFSSSSSSSSDSGGVGFD